MSASTVNRLDIINIGLVLFSCALAFVIPFQLFLFAYGILGPLHYLTEISWLHDKNYYAQSNRDVILLVVLSLMLTVIYLLGVNNPELLKRYFDNEESARLSGHLTFIAFASALFFAFIKKPVIRWTGVVCAILLTVVSDYFLIFFTVFLPTLVHVFVFTSLFMLYGALKSKSNVGYLSVALHLLCPFLLFYLFPADHFLSSLGREQYIKSDFAVLNKFLVFKYFQGPELGQITQDNMLYQVYDSKIGLAIMRFIAFAYTYHYLNWFSKTDIIRWHKVPKARFVVVIVGWLISIVLYSINFRVGFQWLFLLSFMHVMLEFPLNYVSFMGIFSEMRARLFKSA